MSGYHVAVGTIDKKKHYILAGYGYGWATAIRHGKMPRKVLGLLAEHIGRLPEDGEGFLCKKNHEVQDEIIEVAIKPIMDKLADAMQSYTVVKKSRLTWDGENVWQTAEREIALIRPDLERIINFKDASPRLVERCLYVEGQVSTVFVHRSTPGETDKNVVAQLGSTLWI